MKAIAMQPVGLGCPATFTAWGIVDVSRLCLLLLIAAYAVAHEVSVLHEVPGWKRAQDDQEMGMLYRDNMEPDLAPYAGSAFTATNLHDLLTSLMLARPPKHLTLFLVRDNVVMTIPMAAKQPALTTSRVAAMKQGLVNATRAGLQLPDCLFVMNTWDEARCTRGLHTCPVPVFSLIKQWDWQKQQGLQSDVLLPFFNHFYEDIVRYPWAAKDGRALMRAAMQNGMSLNCTRMWLIKLAKTPEASKLLDVGITNNQKKGYKVDVVEQVSIQDHVKWKYLISADGFAASCRFGKLLLTDSVVLKERSRWIEYYYRSVHADRHYVPFTKDDVLQVIKGLPARDAELQRISLAAQQFAYTYLSQQAKAMYVRRALESYCGMFAQGQGGGMKGIVAAMPRVGATGSVLTCAEIVAALRRHSSSLGER